MYVAIVITVHDLYLEQALARVMQMTCVSATVRLGCLFYTGTRTTGFTYFAYEMISSRNQFVSRWLPTYRAYFFPAWNFNSNLPAKWKLAKKGKSLLNTNVWLENVFMYNFFPKISLPGPDVRLSVHIACLFWWVSQSWKDTNTFHSFLSFQHVIYLRRKDNWKKYSKHGIKSTCVFQSLWT